MNRYHNINALIKVLMLNALMCVYAQTMERSSWFDSCTVLQRLSSGGFFLCSVCFSAHCTNLKSADWDLADWKTLSLIYESPACMSRFALTITEWGKEVLYFFLFPEGRILFKFSLRKQMVLAVYSRINHCHYPQLMCLLSPISK